MALFGNLAQDEKDSRRLRIVAIDRLSLGNYLKSPDGKHWHFEGLPDDAILIGVSNDHGFVHDVVLLKFTSSFFDVVPDDEPIPWLTLNVRLVTDPALAGNGRDCDPADCSGSLVEMS